LDAWASREDSESAVEKAKLEGISSEVVTDLKWASALSRNNWICLTNRECKDVSRTDTELTFENGAHTQWLADLKIARKATFIHANMIDRYQRK
jgi:hypothetical protein